MWTRRDLLRAVGAGATLAALGPVGCGGAAREVHQPAAYDTDRLRDALRAAVDTAGARLTRPFAFASIRRRVRAVVDLDRRGLAIDERVVAIVGGRAVDGRWLERATDELTEAGVGRAAAEVVAAAGGARAAPVVTARGPRDHVSIARDPRDVSRTVWLAQADALAARVAAHASSRVIYRAAWLVSDDEQTWIVRADVDHRQRLVRGRAGATMVTWHGNRPVAGEASAAVRGVPDAALVGDDLLARAATDALTLFTPGGAPAGAATLVLAPELIAAVLDRVLARPALAARVTPAAALVVADDPTAPAAFAGHVIDDDGDAARRSALAAGGAPLATPGGSARRSGPRWYRGRGPTHLEVAAGAEPAAALEAAATSGAVLDGLRDLRLDDDGRLVVRAARAFELGRGQRTGRVWGDLELQADVGELLAAISGVSQERAAVILDDDGPPRGALAPWVVTRAALGGGAARSDG